jgi:dienelactone hydrolase
VPDRPEIVCLCGSVRFADEMAATNRDLTLAGAIVLAPAVLPRPDDPRTDGRLAGEQLTDGQVTDEQVTGERLTDEQKAALGVLHLRRIDLADRVLVVNPGGYVGASTNREIAYARAHGKPVSFTEPI